jgi:hypothetical protein
MVIGYIPFIEDILNITYSENENISEHLQINLKVRKFLFPTKTK